MTVNDLLTIFRWVHSIFKIKSINEDMVEHYYAPIGLAPLLPTIWQRGIAKEDMFENKRSSYGTTHVFLKCLESPVVQQGVMFVSTVAFGLNLNPSSAV
ncbi:hypothetical protein M513_02666 [Trichuris suis]|uniref:Uncharacterized protein n=1 Tax=Trichuris suis TaxID=68888 RepID=A0A085MH66_9BILA|nr:hypothetical protein M513_02666 [Trichuris suis]